MAQSNVSKESELQSLLADERERCNQHKQLYQTLKEEHGKLKDELSLVHQQLKEVVSKSEQLQSSKDNYIKKLEEQLREKQKDIYKLSKEVKSYDPKRIRDFVLEEATNHYEVKINELHTEAGQVRKQYATLHYDHTVLKCKLESRESEYSHAIERLKLQHLSEVEQLQNKIESLEKESSFPDDSTAVELKSAKHDILQLNAKLKGILAECEELRAQNENLTFQSSSLNRTHIKQIADNMSNIRSLEEFYKKVRDILNKLTPQTFETVVEQLKNLDINTEERLYDVVDIIFEKAIDGHNSSLPYANMCKHLALIKVQMEGTPPPKNHINFRKLLITKCQKEFEQDCCDELRQEERMKALEVADAERKKELQLEMEEEEKEMRIRQLGNIRFIGQLFKLNMLIEPIMHECIKKLLTQADENSLECLCKLLKTIGKKLDEGKRDQRNANMDQYFAQMQNIVDRQLTSSRVCFILQDVIDLRKNSSDLK